MTRNLQPALQLHRAHVTLNECSPQAVVLDREGVAWQKWGRRWYAAGYSSSYEGSVSEFELAALGPVKVIHEGVKP